MYKKDITKGYNRTYKTPKYDDIEVTDAKRPQREGEVNLLIARKAAKGLPRAGSSITPKVDPYTQVLPDSAPYALLNAMNPMIGGNYGGLDNLDGGNIRQMITSEASTFLHAYDCLQMEVVVNYRYLPMVTDARKVGYGIADQMVKAIDEIQSLASATTYTALPVNSYKIESSIPYSTKSPDDSTAALPGPMYELLIGYQVLLQVGGQVIQTFNKHRMNMGEMMRMSWDRETPLLNSYFGLLQKKSFLSAVQSLSYCLAGEYFDSEWLLQMAAMCNITSRRSDALTEPLLEGFVTHKIPTSFKVFVNSASSTPLFDLAAMDAHADATSDAHPEFKKYGYEFMSIGQMCERWGQLLSIEDTLAWVRQRRAGTTQMTEQDRFRMITYILEEFNYFFGIFKPAMADLRSALDVLSRSGVNRWGKIKGLSIVKATDTKIVRNITLEDMFTTLCAGGVEMSFNSTTYRWTGKTPWNIYLGLPEYDAKSGGSFLSFSTKTLDTDSAPETSRLYIPRAFPVQGNLKALNRLGDERKISVRAVKAADSKILRRLMPLKNTALTIRVAYPAEVSGMQRVDMAMLNWALVKVLGCAATSDPGTTQETINNTTIVLESDILCYLDYEIEDITSEMITYARTKGPFVVNVLDENTVGFLSFGK